MCSCWQRLKGCSVLSYPQYLKFTKTDVTSCYLLTHSRVKSSLASLKANRVKTQVMMSLLSLVMDPLGINILMYPQLNSKEILQRNFAHADENICPLALRGWRDLGQPSSVWAEKHHHRLPVLRRERHLSPRHLQQHTRAALHQHQYPVHSHQPLQSLQGALPSRPLGTIARLQTWLMRMQTNVHRYIDWLRWTAVTPEDSWEMNVCVCLVFRLWRPCVSRATKTLCTF